MVLGTGERSHGFSLRCGSRVRGIPTLISAPAASGQWGNDNLAAGGRWFLFLVRDMRGMSPSALRRLHDGVRMSLGRRPPAVSFCCRRRNGAQTAAKYGPVSVCAMATTSVETVCGYCGVGCGLTLTAEAGPDGSRVLSSTGTGDHPANRGRLCT
ncbi:MAG: hypothetical protein ACLT2I_11240, partial [Corynebacterium variabile]